MNKIAIIKRVVPRALAIFVAVVISFYFALSEKFWLPLAAMLVMQTGVGLALRQGMERFFTIALGVALGTVLVVVIKQPVLIAVLTAILFTLFCYFAVKESLHYFVLSMPFLFALILLITMLLPISHPTILYERLYDVTIGAVVGLVTNLVVFPVRADAEFRNNVAPVLDAYRLYLISIMDLLYKKNGAFEKALASKNRVEQTLQAQSAFFPVWVYQSGLSIALRQGHRHFLVMVERVGQILFSMHHVARYSFDPVLLKDLQAPLEGFVSQSEKILQALATVLSLNKLTEGVSDLTEELAQLEQRFKAVVPLSLELLDMSKEYVYLAAFIHDLKDLRLTQIKLAQALR